MRLIQKQEEPASLHKWLSHDVPHERELMRETLHTMGREKGLEALLNLHDREETRRQKRLKPYNISCWVLYGGMVSTFLAIDIIGLQNVLHHRHLTHSLGWSNLVWGWIIALRLHQLWVAKNKDTPLFSNRVQQNVITSLLDYGDNPLIADALVRATKYYTGDRNRLYERLAHILTLLPNDQEALTQPARVALRKRLSPYFALPFAGEKERLPALQSAITKYFARTEKPLPGSESPRRLEKIVLKFYGSILGGGHKHD